MRLLISVHDVMPSTRSRVSDVLDWLSERQAGPVVLLVVPGSGWDAGGVEWLRSLERAGHELAGHGWRHAVEHYGGVYHRLHGALISRRVAEHLALDRDGIAALVRRCHGWFGEVGLRPPRLYVPPAWAMGPLGPEQLPRLPFEWYEDLAGYWSRQGQCHRVPVVGYESDRAWTRPFLRLFNRHARRRGRRRGLLRVAIHPDDLRLSMAADLARCLDSVPPAAGNAGWAALPDLLAA